MGIYAEVIAKNIKVILSNKDIVSTELCLPYSGELQDFESFIMYRIQEHNIVPEKYTPIEEGMYMLL